MASVLDIQRAHKLVANRAAQLSNPIHFAGCSVWLFFVVVQKFFGSLYRDLLLPIVGLATGGVELTEMPWLLASALNFMDQFGEYFLTFLSAILLGRLYLRLPEISVAMPFKGARRAFTKKQKWSYYLSLGTVFLAALLFQKIDSAIWANITDVTGVLLFLPFSSILSLVFWATGVTLLSVVYRRNLLNRESEVNLETNTPQ